MDFELFPSNINKVLESKHIPKYINTKNNLKIEIINYETNKNINKYVISAYKNKPDVLIINFNTNQPELFDNIPRYPVFVNNTFYITPICYQQVNGFSNNINNKEELINDFVERIKRTLGGIIAKKNFKYPNVSSPNILFDMNSGIKDFMYNNKFDKNWFVNNIPKWMTTHIDINNVGWFSPFNQIALDYVFENYKIDTTAELGAYYGRSSKYIASKNKNSALYSFDLFDNILLTNYIVKTITPLDVNYFFKYIKFESFHAKMADYNKVYSVKYDCFDAPNLLHKNNMKIDLFYIDFCKKDKLLIKFVDNLFRLYPNCIVIGDDAVMLSYSLEYFKNKYNYIYMTDCYICSYKTKLVNVDKVLKKYELEKKYQNTEDIELLKDIGIDYKINYIAKLMDRNMEPSKIIECMEILNIDPNTKSSFLVQYSNLFHHIAYSLYKNKKYYLDLYEILNKKYTDKDILNNLNLIPSEYFNYELNSQFS